MIKSFEAYESNEFNWREEFIDIYDVFVELEDIKIGRLDYQCGFRTSTNSKMYPCFIKNDEIMGDGESIDSACVKGYGRFLARVTIYPTWSNSNYSPFSQYGESSYFGENAEKILEITKVVTSIKTKMPLYEIGISFSDVIYIYFLRKKD
jgi:hypothetical protein